jgi:hypothetical protein
LISSAVKIAFTSQGGEAHGLERLVAERPKSVRHGASVSGGGGDQISGESGDDAISSGFGDDTLDGGTGGNTLTESEDANMTLTDRGMTGLGTDVISHISTASLKGDSGNNTLDASGFSGPVTPQGGGGNDRLIGGSSSDFILGGNGDDTLTGNAGTDTILGQDGADVLDENRNASFKITKASLDIRSEGSVTYEGNYFDTIEWLHLTGAPSGEVLDAALSTILATQSASTPTGAAVAVYPAPPPQLSVHTASNSVIANGDASPSASDFTDFGDATTNNGTTIRTWILANLDGEVLNMSGNPAVTIIGDNASDFTITKQPDATIPTKATTSVVLTPAEISVIGNGQAIENGNAVPSLIDGTEFVSVHLGHHSTSHFEIVNEGQRRLSLTGSPRIEIVGANAADFRVTTRANVGLSANERTGFEITFRPKATGLRTATVRILNNVSDEGTFEFAIAGNG